MCAALKARHELPELFLLSSSRHIFNQRKFFRHERVQIQLDYFL
jgi:hypothetical protein